MEVSEVQTTSRPKVWWRALVLAIPFFMLGLAIGAYLVHDHYTRIQPGFIAMFGTSMAGLSAQAQYEQASYPEAKAALEHYLKILLDPAQDLNPLSDSRTRRFDAVLTWGRLALLNEHNGRPDLAEAAWHHAEELARQSTWRDPSRGRLRIMLERLDSPRLPVPDTKPGA